MGSVKRFVLLPFFGKGDKYKRKGERNGIINKGTNQGTH